jgi:dimethylargininase
MRVFDFNRALVRAPSPSVVEGLRAVDLGPPKLEGVILEHDAYIRALEDAGVSVEVLGPLDEYPDSVFVEDTALVFAGAAILLQPGAPTRRGEVREILPALERNFARVLHLDEGFVDGGDVLATAGRIFIGRSARTTPGGARALVALLAEIGLQGTPVTTPSGVLHLKSECSLLDEETLLATARLAAEFEGFRIVTVPHGEEAAANAVRVNDRVLIGDAYPRTAELLVKSGYEIAPLPTREIAKIDAGLSCMSLRWRATG